MFRTNVILAFVAAAIALGIASTACASDRPATNQALATPTAFVIPARVPTPNAAEHVKLGDPGPDCEWRVRQTEPVLMAAKFCGIDFPTFGDTTLPAAYGRFRQQQQTSGNALGTEVPCPIPAAGYRFSRSQRLAAHGRMPTANIVGSRAILNLCHWEHCSMSLRRCALEQRLQRAGYGTLKRMWRVSISVF